MRTTLKYAAALLLSSMCVSFAHGQDLSAQEKFNALQAAGVFKAAGNGSADLDQAMNRAQFARVAALMLGLDGLDSQGKPPATSAFTDVPASDWAGWISSEAAKPFFEGEGATFSPDQMSNVSVEQLAKVLVTTLGLEVDMDAQVEGASGWAQGYVAAAVAAGLIPPSVDYTQPAIRQDLVGAAFAASASILGEETLDQGMVDPDDVNPQNEVTSQDLVSMLTPNTEQAGTQGGQSAIVPGKDEPSLADDNLVPNNQIANEVLIDKLVLQSVALAAADSPNAPDVPGGVPGAPGTPDAGAMYPYFDAGFITPGADMPQGLMATYIGRADGAFTDGTAVGGALTMNVDFATSASAGSISSGIMFDHAMGSVDFILTQNVNGIAMSGVTGSYGPSNAMDPITGGNFAGQFYGPSAQEVGGVWGIETDSALYANGNYNGKR